MPIDSGAKVPPALALDHSGADLPQAHAVRHACRILVVDDDHIARTAIAALLRMFRYQVEVASTGEEALRIWRATPCDIVLTDWQMPGMDGLALCRRLRLMSHDAYLYIVMLSVRGAERDILIGLGAGADDYVVKGASIDELMARIEIGRRITHASHQEQIQSRGPARSAHDRQYLLQHLPREIARAQRHEHALAVLSCHVDTRQSGGHGWTRWFLERAASALRTSDWCARTGPSGFMIILPETSAQDAHRVADKLHRSFTPGAPSAALVPIEFTVTIEVTAVAAAYDSASYSRMYDLLRATRECRGPPAEDVSGRANVFYIAGGSKDEIN